MRKSFLRLAGSHLTKQLPLAIILMIFSCHEKEEDQPVVDNCRVAGISLDDEANNWPAINFYYNNDGTLHSYTTNHTNSIATLQYDHDMRVRQIVYSGSSHYTVRYEYPQDGVVHWYTDLDPSVNHYLYQHENKIDSFKAVSSESTYVSKIEYNGEDVSRIVAIAPGDTIIFDNIQYEPGINPQYRLYKSSGIISDYGILHQLNNIIMPNFLSKHNVIAYTQTEHTKSFNGVDLLLKGTFEYGYQYGSDEINPMGIQEYFDGQFYRNVSIGYQSCEHKP